MADRVQYIMDRLSATFRQLADLKIFRQDEIKSIVKRRTDFEYVLRRRQLTTADFYSYLQYELNLEKLRVLRSKTDGPFIDKDRQHALRVVEIACLRHICYVFERGIRRFPAEIGFWNDYIVFLKEKNSIALLNTTFGKALSLNPKNEDLWMQAAAHELETNNNLHAARVLLQRSLRANKESRKLWTRYFELELWSALRIVERQRLLGLNIDDAPIEGAPIVVFKHAIRAFPADIHFACEMHASSAKVSLSLADTLEKQLRKAHKFNTDLWSYLAHLAFDRAVGADDAAVEKKRRRGRLEAVNTIAHVYRGLEESVKVLTEAQSVFQSSSASTAQDDETTAEVKKDMKEQYRRLPLMLAQTVEKILEKSKSILGAISEVAVVEMLPKESEDTSTGNVSNSNSGEKNKNKKRRKDSSGAALSNDGDSNDNDDNDSDSELTATAKRVTLLLGKLESALQSASTVLDIATDIVVIATPAAELSSSTVIGAAAAAAAVAAAAAGKHVNKNKNQLQRLLSVQAATLNAKTHISLIGSAFRLPALSADESTGAVAAAIEWTEKTAELLRGATKGIFSSGSLDTDFEVSVTAWGSVVNELLSSLLRRSDNAAAADDNVEVPLGSDLRRVLSAASSGAEFAACCDSGSELLLRCIELLLLLSPSDSSVENVDGHSSVGSNSSVEIEAIFRAVVASPYLMKGTRGLWAARYVRFVAAVLLPVSGSARESPLRDAVGYVEGHLASRPDLMVDAALEPFYDAVLSLEMLRARLPASATAGATAAGATAGATAAGATAAATAAGATAAAAAANELAFARDVAQSAVKVCPYVRSFWEKYEEIERLRGDYKSANHICWKKNSLTKEI